MPTGKCSFTYSSQRKLLCSRQNAAINQVAEKAGHGEPSPNLYILNPIPTPKFQGTSWKRGRTILKARGMGFVVR